MTTKPLISVIMPVFNASKWLAEAIESVLGQTFGDFELIIVDDGSTDSSPDLMEEYRRTDNRIRIERNLRNYGRSYSMNRGMELAKTDLLARMDADDACLPNRLRIQYEFMRVHPEISVCSSYMSIYDISQKRIAPPEDNDSIRAMLFFESSIMQPAVVLRKSAIENEQYDSSLTSAEDYDLWTRLALKPSIRFYNIPDVLLRYRESVNVDNHEYQGKMASNKYLVQEKFLALMGANPSEMEFQVHKRMSSLNKRTSVHDLFLCKKWLIKLYGHVEKSRICSTSAFQREAALRWRRFARLRWIRNPLAVGIYFFSEFGPFGRTPPALQDNFS